MLLVLPIALPFLTAIAALILRRSRGDLYRKVLARYVQMATAGGVNQAFYPEGGLSLSGGLGRPKLGLGFREQAK